MRAVCLTDAATDWRHACANMVRLEQKEERRHNGDPVAWRMSKLLCVLIVPVCFLRLNLLLFSSGVGVLRPFALVPLAALLRLAICFIGGRIVGSGVIGGGVFGRGFIFSCCTFLIFLGFVGDIFLCGCFLIALLGLSVFIRGLLGATLCIFLPFISFILSCNQCRDA